LFWRGLGSPGSEPHSFGTCGVLDLTRGIGGCCAYPLLKRRVDLLGLVGPAAGAFCVTR
jgi:hypothetical protein